MEYFAGLDVSLRSCAICVVDNTGKVLFERELACEVGDIAACLTDLAHPIERIGFEAGTMSQHLYFGKGCEKLFKTSQTPSHGHINTSPQAWREKHEGSADISQGRHLSRKTKVLRSPVETAPASRTFGRIAATAESNPEPTRSAMVACRSSKKRPIRKTE